MYEPVSENSQKLLVYFHGNAEDLGMSLDFLSCLRVKVKMDIIAMEYPGYGVYQHDGASPSEKSILEDAYYLL